MYLEEIVNNHKVYMHITLYFKSIVCIPSHMIQKKIFELFLIFQVC